MKFAACLEYDGAPFHGWQRQNDLISVQEVVENALSTVADSPVAVVTAGRTDTAVNASAQVIHFETDAVRSEYSWLRGVNSNLPDTARVLWIKQVPEDFHARFGATGRRYRYIILNRLVATALHRHRATHEHRALDVEKMQAAAAALVGHHDFSSFRAAGCQARSPEREIRSISVNASGQWIWIDVYADGFLYHMVRNIAGVLMQIGAGESPVSWCAEVLAAKDRTAGGVTAGPSGLYLTGVEYETRFELPETPAPPVFWG